MPFKAGGYSCQPFCFSGAAGVLVGEDNLEGVFRHMDFGLPCCLFVGEVDAGKPRAKGFHQLEAVKD